MIKKILLPYLLLLYVTVSAQHPEDITNKLLKEKVIDKSQKREVTEQLNSKLNLTSSAILEAVQHAEYIKVAGKKKTDDNGIFMFNEPNEKQREKLNTDLTEFLSRLYKAELINPSGRDSLLNDIKANLFAHKIQLLDKAYNMTRYQEWMNSDKLNAFAKELHTENIINEGAYFKLKKDISAQKMKSNFQLISYCNNAKAFNLSNYSSDKNLYLEQIHREVSSILPELTFTDFNFKVVVDEYESNKDRKVYNVVVSLMNNGRQYTHTSFISLDTPEKGMEYFGRIDHEQFYQIFNKILADHHSAYRLHLINISQSDLGLNARDYSRFGIIALTQEQTKSFRISGSYLDLSYESFKNTLTTEKILEAVKVYQSIGLLSHLSDEEIKTCINKVIYSKNENLNDVITKFPQVAKSFDLELFAQDAPYAELTKSFSQISKGAFQPANPSDNFGSTKTQKVSFKFDLNGKTYKKELHQYEDWADVSFIDLINTSLSENNIKGRFYDLYEGGQGAIVIFLTDEQKDYLKSKKLLVFTEHDNGMED